MKTLRNNDNFNPFCSHNSLSFDKIARHKSKKQVKKSLKIDLLPPLI